MIARDVPPHRLLLPMWIAAGLAAAALALSLTLWLRDPLQILFASRLVGPLLAGLGAWVVIAAGARRLLVGASHSIGQFAPRALLLTWVGYQCVTLTAVVLLASGWLLALALGLPLRTALLRALMLTTVAAWLVRLMINAAANSALILRRAGGRRT